MKTLIAPSILSADFGRLAEEIKRAEAAGADWIHVDVMDGQFVPNITIGPAVVKACRAATSLPVDVHLMIANPDRYLDDFAAAGAHHLVVHAEACVHLHRTLQAIRKLGIRSGVAFNPATPIHALAHVLDMVDIALIMSVNPGFGGQRFIASCLPKIRAVREMVAESGFDIDVQVDGGVSPVNAGSVKAAGANVLVAGSAVFGETDYRVAIDAIRNS